MKQRQDITTVRLRMARTDLSPVVAADAPHTSESVRMHRTQQQVPRPLIYALSPEQMDGVHGGLYSVAAWQANNGFCNTDECVIMNLLDLWLLPH